MVYKFDPYIIFEEAQIKYIKNNINSNQHIIRTREKFEGA